MTMNAPILVTGGTGTLGRLVVSRLRAAGHNVRVLSRHRHDAEPGIEYVIGDLATGEGLDAVEGVRTILHLGGSAKGDDVKTQHLVQAAAQAGVKHLAYISVVGADRVPVVSGIDRASFGYFASKLAAERVIEHGGVPWTILRATQFQESLLMVARQMTRSPVIPVFAGVRFQPIAADEVADRLVALALGGPAGRAPDMAGPRVYGMGELFRAYLRASHKRRLILPIKLPGRAARAFRAGANLAPERTVGRRTWEELLTEQVRPGNGSLHAAANA
jgi:uncharacterized protein YbjT (DUF2867 family)